MGVFNTNLRPPLSAVMLMAKRSAKTRVEFTYTPSSKRSKREVDLEIPDLDIPSISPVPPMTMNQM
eukprot:scaffold72627_cov54-Attheya_sp.AAC.3